MFPFILSLLVDLLELVHVDLVLLDLSGLGLPFPSELFFLLLLLDLVFFHPKLFPQGMQPFIVFVFGPALFLHLLQLLVLAVEGLLEGLGLGG